MGQTCTTTYFVATYCIAFAAFCYCILQLHIPQHNYMYMYVYCILYAFRSYTCTYCTAFTAFHGYMCILHRSDRIRLGQKQRRQRNTMFPNQGDQMLVNSQLLSGCASMGYWYAATKVPFLQSFPSLYAYSRKGCHTKVTYILHVYIRMSNCKLCVTQYEIKCSVPAVPPVTPSLIIIIIQPE